MTSVAKPSHMPLVSASHAVPHVCRNSSAGPSSPGINDRQGSEQGSGHEGQDN